MALYVGCPMWGLKSWVGNFFPDGTRQKDFLAAYSRRLNTVEGNTTFYALPAADLVERWRDETPPGFRFCLKFPQAITHTKRLHDAQAETEAFADRLRRLGDRRGPAFLQLPPSFTAQQLPALEAYLAEWPADLACAVEARHASFFGGPTGAAFEAVLRRFNAAQCVFDTSALFSVPASQDAEIRAAQAQKPRFPARDTRTAPFAFIRFLSHPDPTANRPWLEPWAERVAGWLRGGDDVYIFLHHPDNTHAPEVARLFHGMVAARTPVEPLPDWGDGMTQARLL